MQRPPQYPPASPYGGAPYGQPPPRQPPAKTAYMTPVAQTAPAPYPYAGGAAPDPRAVGPAWSVPAAHRPSPQAYPYIAAAPYVPAPAPAPSHPYGGFPPQHQQYPPRPQPLPARPPEPARGRARAARAPAPFRDAPKKPGLFRRFISALFTLISVLVLVAGGLFVTLALTGQRSLLGLTEEDLPVVLPEQPIAIPSITPLALVADKTAEAAWSSGTCGDFSNERDTPAYQAGRNSGSAQDMRGKTAALVIKLHSSSLVWTKATELNVDRAALMTQRFYLTQAKARGIVDLKFDVIPWGLKTPYTMPDLALDASQRLAPATMDLIRDSSRLAVETALGAKLDRVVNELRKSGYVNVAFFVAFPVKTKARNFAIPTYRSAPKDYPEAAYLFAPTTDFGHFAVTMAHEGMHLFGADDLYRIKTADRRDDDDVMGEYCTGFKKAKVGDATAFAVGWQAAPPPRTYGFEVK